MKRYLLALMMIHFEHYRFLYCVLYCRVAIQEEQEDDRLLLGNKNYLHRISKIIFLPFVER